MTEVTSNDVRHLAQLSSLQLSDDEINALQTDLTNILGYVEQLSQLDTDGVEPTYQVSDLENIWREDTVINYGISTQELLSLAPAQANDQVKVPKVL